MNWLQRATTPRPRRLSLRSRDGTGQEPPETRHPEGQPDPDRGPSRRDFEDLALPHAAALYRTACYLTANAVEAEDLTQETFLRAFRGFAGFRGEDPRAWLFAILRHAFIDDCRRRGRVTLVESDAVEDGALGGWAPSAESEVLRQIPSEQIDRAFAALPEEWRMIVLLADVEDLSYKEIAQAMEIPIGTVMSRLHRARKRLHGQLVAARVAHDGTV